jgi:adenosylcobinamide-GDP ribazoletransferase
VTAGAPAALARWISCSDRTAGEPWRAAAIALAAALPYAGSASGTGGWTRGVGLGRCIAALVLASGVGVLTAGPVFGAMAAAGVIVAGVVGRWSRRRLGGVTGDTLGAATEVAETACLVTAAALL